MSIWAALALAFVQAQPSPGKDFSPIEVRSADGACLARIDRAPRQERVADDKASFMLTVLSLDDSNARHELWHQAYAFDSSPARYILANRGRAFVEVEEYFRDSPAVLQIYARDREVANVSGVSLHTLGLHNDTLADTKWLDEKLAPSIEWADGAYGPALLLEIHCRAGNSFALDLSRVDVPPKAGAESMNPPRVEPPLEPADPARIAAPFVQSVEFPSVARAGRGIEIKIAGSHATPGWKFLGFQLRGESDILTLTPQSVRPEGIVPQVLTPFHASARLVDWCVGKYTIDVVGWDKQGALNKVEVLPESLLASLNTSGGFAGVDQRVELHAQGILRRVFRREAGPNFLELSDERMKHLRQLLVALPPRNRRASTAGAADLFNHRLGFWSGDNWITIEVDDLAATGAERELIQALRED